MSLLCVEHYEYRADIWCSRQTLVFSCEVDFSTPLCIHCPAFCTVLFWSYLFVYCNQSVAIKLRSKRCSYSTCSMIVACVLWYYPGIQAWQFSFHEIRNCTWNCDFILCKQAETKKYSLFINILLLPSIGSITLAIAALLKVMKKYLQLKASYRPKWEWTVKASILKLQLKRKILMKLNNWTRK